MPRRMRFAPWEGSPGQVSWTEPGSTLRAAAGASAFGSAGKVAARGALAAQAARSTYASAGTVTGGAGARTGVLAAAAQRASTNAIGTDPAVGAFAVQAQLAAFAAAGVHPDKGVLGAAVQAAAYAGAGTVTGGGAAAWNDPLTIFTGGKHWFFSGSNGYSGSQWDDASGNGKHATQATGSKQPALQSGGLNGRNTLLWDGSDDWMQLAGWDPPAPGTTPIFIWAVFRQLGWTVGKSIYAGSTSTRLRLAQSTSTPGLTGNNTTATSLNNGAAINTWVRSEHLFNNSTTDYLKLGSTSVTGVNQGNTDALSGSFILGAQSVSSGSTQCANVELACILGLTYNPSGAELSAASAWVTSFYGGSVGV